MRAFRGASRGPPFLTAILFELLAPIRPLFLGGSGLKVVSLFLVRSYFYKVETKLLLHVHLILYSKKKRCGIEPKWCKLKQK